METDLQEQIHQLSERSQLAEMMNDASIDRVLAMDKDLNIIAWNQMCERVTGLDRQHALGRNFMEIFPAAKNCEEIKEAIEQALQGRKFFVPADKGCYEEGHYERHFVPLREDDGTLRGILVIAHDVAHRMKAEHELKALNKALARKNRELKSKHAELLTFAHVTSHDLKEPLRKIYVFIEMLMGGEADNLSAEGRTHFKRIQASVQRMGMLTDDILTFAELNRNNEHRQDVELDKICRFAIHNLGPVTEERNAQISYKELPAIKGYRTLLTQMFQHLISNAIKFQPEGGVPRLDISARQVKGSEIHHADAQADVMYTCISFADNGIGFDQKYAEKIFQMFQRLNRAETYAGTGIGLALCRKVAELHGGFITVASETDKGSTFHCYFPAG